MRELAEAIARHAADDGPALAARLPVLRPAVARRLIALDRVRECRARRVDEDADRRSCRCSPSRRAAWCSCSASAAATSCRAIRSSSRVAAGPAVAGCARDGLRRPGARPPPARRRAARPRGRRVRRHPRARRSPRSASSRALAPPEGVRPDRVLGSHRPRTGEGSAGAGHRARGRVAADRRGRCVVRVPGGDARPVRDALRGGRAVGLGTTQPAPACRSRPSGAPSPGSGLDRCAAASRPRKPPARCADTLNHEAQLNMAMVFDIRSARPVTRWVPCARARYNEERHSLPWFRWKNKKKRAGRAGRRTHRDSCRPG